MELLLEKFLSYKSCEQSKYHFICLVVWFHDETFIMDDFIRLNSLNLEVKIDNLWSVKHAPEYPLWFIVYELSSIIYTHYVKVFPSDRQTGEKFTLKPLFQEITFFSENSLQWFCSVNFFIWREIKCYDKIEMNIMVINQKFYNQFYSVWESRSSELDNLYSTSL